MTEEILTAIKEADLVLVGLGEEFDETGVAAQDDCYASGKAHLAAEDRLWMLPSYDKQYRNTCQSVKSKEIGKALENLKELLKEKNYFVVSTAMNDAIAAVPWKYDRLVMPCGTSVKKQCVDGCEEGLQAVSEEEERSIAEYMQGLQKTTETAKVGTVQSETVENAALVTDLLKFPELGVCPKCGKTLILNNIYAEHYDEKGYLSQWQLYTKWLQGTLNRKLVILELGVGMKFPSVIRWPFEKVTFFNNKAHMYRVNEKLYQLSEELKGKGTAIPKNSIDWLLSLC